METEKSIHNGAAIEQPGPTYLHLLLLLRPHRLYGEWKARQRNGTIDHYEGGLARRFYFSPYVEYFLSCCRICGHHGTPLRLAGESKHVTTKKVDGHGKKRGVNKLRWEKISILRIVASK